MKYPFFFFFFIPVNDVPREPPIRVWLTRNNNVAWLIPFALVQNDLSDFVFFPGRIYFFFPVHTRSPVCLKNFRHTVTTIRVQTTVICFLIFFLFFRYFVDIAGTTTHVVLRFRFVPGDAFSCETRSVRVNKNTRTFLSSRNVLRLRHYSACVIVFSVGLCALRQRSVKLCVVLNNIFFKFWARTFSHVSVNQS